jgi:integrase/recombinase XerD
MRPNHALQALVNEFLADLAYTNRSAHTLRGYASDLRDLVNFHRGTPQRLDAEALRAFSKCHAHLSPATRARKQAAVSSFLTWAYRHDRIKTNPMLKIERVRRPPRVPRPLSRESIEAVLTTIPTQQRRDRVLFRLLFETGLRIGEALLIHLEDLDLTRDNERLTVTGKGGQQRTILLDDPRLLKELRAYLKATGYQHGYLFRAIKNGDGEALRYQSIQQRWAMYCNTAEVSCTIHQLRHSHATEMLNGGVSLGTIRKRLGHKSIQTTLLYADKSDASADAELRAWRRQQRKR